MLRKNLVSLVNLAGYATRNTLRATARKVEKHAVSIPATPKGKENTKHCMYVFSIHSQT